MTKHPLAVVSLLAFMIGGAAAVVFNYPPRRGTGSEEVAERTADAAPAAASETDAPTTPAAEVKHTEEEAAPDGFDDPVDRLEAEGVGPSRAEGEAVTREAAAEGEKSSGGARARPATSWQAAESTPAPAASVRVSRAQGPPVVRTVAGGTVGGVKKTGQGVKKAGVTIGKTFGKIGGVFND